MIIRHITSKQYLTNYTDYCRTHNADKHMATRFTEDQAERILAKHP